MNQQDPPVRFDNLKDALNHPEDAFELILANRNLRALSPKIAELPNLELLDISKNPLGELPDWLFALPSLRLLFADATGITRVPDALGSLTDLEVIILGGFDRFTALPPSLTSLRHLRILDLTDATHLAALPDLTPLTELEALFLVRTRRLENVAEALTRVPPLRRLMLDSIPFTQLPPKPGPLSELRYLHLTGSNLTQLPSWIGDLQHLEKLYLEDNMSLESLPDALGNLTSLKELYIGLSLDIPLPETLGNLRNLEKLSLVSCRLDSFPEWIFRLENLQSAYIALSSVTAISPEIARLKNLKSLDLGYNPELYPQRAQLQAWLPNCEIYLEGDDQPAAPPPPPPPPVARPSSRDASTAPAWPELLSLAAWTALPATSQARVAQALAQALGPDSKVLEPHGAYRFPRLHHPASGITWIAIAGGEFQMGLSPQDQQSLQRITRKASPEARLHASALQEIARPLHAVLLPPFLCAESPVQDSSEPVTLFPPAAALDFALSRSARLLSEAECEYLLRHASSDPWPPPGQGLRSLATLAGKTIEAGLDAEPPTPCGLRGLGWGSWVEDSWHPDYTGAPADGSAWEPVSPPELVRGGAFLSFPWQLDAEALLLHPAHRESLTDGRFPLRLARNLPPRPGASA